jgi:hypothetical protein
MSECRREERLRAYADRFSSVDCFLHSVSNPVKKCLRLGKFPNDGGDELLGVGIVDEAREIFRDGAGEPLSLQQMYGIAFPAGVSELLVAEKGLAEVEDSLGLSHPVAKGRVLLIARECHDEEVKHRDVVLGVLLRCLEDSVVGSCDAPVPLDIIVLAVAGPNGSIEGVRKGGVGRNQTEQPRDVAAGVNWWENTRPLVEESLHCTHNTRISGGIAASDPGSKVEGASTKLSYGELNPLLALRVGAFISGCRPVDKLVQMSLLRSIGLLAGSGAWVRVAGFVGFEVWTSSCERYRSRRGRSRSRFCRLVLFRCTRHIEN